MIEPELISLDKVSTRRELLVDLIEHFSYTEILAKEHGQGQMEKIAKDATSTVLMLKRLLFRDISYIDEKFLDEQTRGLYAVNLEGAQRGTPLEKPYVRNEI